MNPSKPMRRWPMSTALLLSCLPLWGNDPQIHVDEAQSTFRVSGVVAKEALPNPIVLGGHTDNVAEVSLSADGRLVLSGGDEGDIRLWDAQTGDLLHVASSHRTPYKDGAWAVSLSRDGSLALSGGVDNAVRLWDTRTGKHLHAMEGHEHQVTSVALSADGSLALSGSRDETLRLWDAKTGEHLRTMTGHWGWVQAVSLSADGSLALSGSPDKTVRVWDAQTGKLLHTMAGHEDEVFGVSLSADGSLALSGGFDGTVRLWDVRTGKLLRTMRGHEGRVFGVSLSPDGSRALSGGDDKTVRLWNARTGELLHTMTGHQDRVEGVVLSADGRFALSAGWDQTVLLWRLSWLDSPSAPSTSPGAEATAKDARARNWRQLPLVLRGHEQGVIGVALSADGRFALSGGEDNTVRFWDTTTGKLVHTFDDHWRRGGYDSGGIGGVSLSADGRFALSGGWDTTVRLWDTTTGRLLHTMAGHRGRVQAVSLSADGSIALSGGDDKTVRVWDAQTGKLLHTMEGHEDEVFGVSLSADGRLALSGGGDEYSYSSDSAIRLWDATTGELLHTMEGYWHTVLDVSLSADGRLALFGGGLWTGYGNVSVLLWDMATRLWEVSRRRVTSVSLTPDGRLALSGGEAEPVRLWDATTGEPLHAMAGYDGEVYGVAMTPDGRLALSGGSNRTVTVRNLPVVDPPWSLRQAAERYAGQAMAEHIGPAIPAPALPPLLPPVREHQQDPSETAAMFEQRMTRARAERDRQISDIRAQYRAAVQQRNAKIGSLEKSQLQRIHLHAYAQAVAEVLGHPVLEPQYDDRGNPRHEAQSVPPGMHITLQFEHAKHFEDWRFEVPPGEPARDLQAALEAGTVSATTEYRLQDGVLSLTAVYAHHGDQRYVGTPAPQGDSSTAGIVAVPGIHLHATVRQNPNLKDTTFERHEAQQRSAFDDDIPSLFEQAEAAEPDPRKWLFVIGVEHYEQTDNIPHARRSAHWFAKAAAKALGITQERQVILLDGAATAAAIKQGLARIQDGAREGDRVYFYYAGHGIPAPTQDNAPHILPQDVIPNFVHEDDATGVESIHRTLTGSNAAQVIAFMDTCFTGMTDGASVFKDKPTTGLTPKQLKPPRNGKLATLTACNAKQHPSAHAEKGHRLFSYFLIRELLKGEHATIGALHKRVAADVASTTANLGTDRKQNPTLQGNRSLPL